MKEKQLKIIQVRNGHPFFWSHKVLVNFDGFSSSKQIGIKYQFSGFQKEDKKYWLRWCSA
jgi:hypothetical protein